MDEAEDIAEDIIDDDELLELTVAADDEDDALLSANASGMRATVAETAAKRERDFFI